VQENTLTICCTVRHSVVLLRALDSYNMTQLDSDLSTPQGVYMFHYHGTEIERDALPRGTVICVRTANTQLQHPGQLAVIRCR